MGIRFREIAESIVNERIELDDQGEDKYKYTTNEWIGSSLYEYEVKSVEKILKRNYKECFGFPKKTMNYSLYDENELSVFLKAYYKVFTEQQYEGLFETNNKKEYINKRWKKGELEPNFFNVINALIEECEPYYNSQNISNKPELFTAVP